MGSNVSLCTSSCHRPSSPSESISSFLKVAPETLDQKGPDKDGKKLPLPALHVSNPECRRCISQTDSCPNSSIIEDYPSDCPSLTTLLRREHSHQPSSNWRQSCLSDSTAQASSNPSSVLWLSVDDDCFSTSTATSPLGEQFPSLPRSSFLDPYIEELNGNAPNPPPPPLPPKKKKQQPSDKPSRGNQGNDPELPRIYPIIKNGKQISKTHYWVIPAPTKKQPNFQGGKKKTRSCEDYLVNSKLDQPYVNVDEHHYSPNPSSLLHPPVMSLSSSTSATNETSTTSEFDGNPRITRVRSENYKECLWNMHRGQIIRLLSVIPTATEREAHDVLLGCDWNFDEAVKRLKKEIVYRQLGCTSMKHSDFLLKKHNWDLIAAIREADYEHRQRLSIKQEF